MSLTMASDFVSAPGPHRCYYCQVESTENTFKYFDNKKVDQPRFKCHNCHKLFTAGSHGRPQGRTYAKKRNEDPEELKNLSRQCRHCGVEDNAVFKYYNNHNRLQPRFKCLSCGKQFQMRLMGIGDEMRLVHTSCNQRHATDRCKKPREPAASMNASNFEEESFGESYVYHPSDGSFMSMLFDPVMPLEVANTRLLPEICTQEDLQYASFVEGELMDENERAPSADSMPMPFDPVMPVEVASTRLLPEICTQEDLQYASFVEGELIDENERAPSVDSMFCTLNQDDGLPSSLSGVENAEFLASLEADFLTDGYDAPWNVDTFSSPANIDDGLFPWSNNDADLIEHFELMEAGVRAHEFDGMEMVSENMTTLVSDCTSSPEVVSDTLLVETHIAPALPSSGNDTIEDVNYMEAAIACCKLMDMARSMPVAPAQLGGSSSSSVGSTTSFGDSSCETSKPVSFQQDMKEEHHCDVYDYNEWQEEDDDMMIMSPEWSCLS